MRLSYTNLMTNSLSVGLGLTVGGLVGTVVGVALLPIQLLGNGIETLAGSPGVEIGKSVEEMAAAENGKLQADLRELLSRNTASKNSPRRTQRTEEPRIEELHR